jgi:peptide/nickel transport system permease protein
VILLLVRRVLIGLLTLWAASVLVFAGTELLPGDVATVMLGQEKTPESVAALREKLGLDKPAPVRYFRWFTGLLSGEMGDSLVSRKPVADIIPGWVKNTFVLAGFTALIAIPLSLMLGMVSAAYPNSLLDRSISITSLMIVSVPEFLTASVLVMVLAVQFNWLPATSHISAQSSGASVFKALVLPMTTLTIASLAYMTRMTRAAIMDVLRSPYVEMAVLKGVPKGRIILFHALPNALGPIVNVIALVLGYLVSGVVVVEAVFAYPGMGRLLLDSVGLRDFPMIQALAMIFCGFYICVNLLADVLAMLTNPRLGEEG